MTPDAGLVQVLKAAVALTVGVLPARTPALPDS